MSETPPNYLGTKKHESVKNTETLSELMRIKKITLPDMVDILVSLNLPHDVIQEFLNEEGSLSFLLAQKKHPVNVHLLEEAIERFEMSAE